jgi:hypothetical protein
MQPQCVESFIRYPNGVRVHGAVRRREQVARAPVRAGGICFSTSRRLPAGQTVQLSLDTPGGAQDITVTVAWSQVENGAWLTAARIAGDGDACRARLAAQLCLIDAYRRTERARGRDLDEETAAREWIARYAHEVPSLS